MSRINVMQPWLGEEEVAAVAEVDRAPAGWPRARGSPSSRRRSPSAMQAEHAVAVVSCTTALHLALVVAGVGPGDEVVVPSFSFIATANAARYVGARPVFADVDPVTGNLTAETVAAALTDAHPRGDRRGPGRRAGRPRRRSGRCATRAASSWSRTRPAAPGSTYRGRPVGAGAEIAAWSFHPRKILTTGEGGMLTTSTPSGRRGPGGCASTG